MMLVKWLTVGLVVIFIQSCLEFGYVKSDDFPSLLTANASMAIILDREYLDNEYDDVLLEMKVIIERVLRENLKNGGLIVSYYSWTKINFRKDFTAVFSVTNCENTWDIFRDARSEHLLLIALTDPDCPRLPIDEAIMIPITSPGEELPQVILDLRLQKAISWTSAILLYDSTFDRDMISRAVIALSKNFPKETGDNKPLSLSVYRIMESEIERDRRKFIRNLLKNLPTKFIGTNFMVLVTSKLMIMMMEIARELGMVDTESQWFYVISDTNYIQDNITMVTPLIEEGNNVAFIYNYTKTSDECVTGIKCHANELLKSFVLGLSRSIREEHAVYQQISDEEWEIVRPSKRQRRRDILEFMLNGLSTTSKCSNCTTWRVNSADIWGNQYTGNRHSTHGVGENVHKNQDEIGFKLMNTGLWKPFRGLRMTDVLFPHVSHGFRGRNFHILTYHNPPWQYITVNEQGIVDSSNGIMIDILEDVAKMLNFTYTLHAAQLSTNLNFSISTDDYTNGTNSREIHLLTTEIPTEVLNLLSDNQIILSAIACTVNERYKRFINFSIPISIQPYSFLIAKPKEVSRIFLFAAPFNTGTWLCLGGLIIILPPILCLVSRLTPFYDYHGRATKQGLFKIDNCFWYIYGALLQQGGLYLPTADSGRIIIGAWWLIVLVMVTTYCGNLVAFLTFPTLETKIDSIAELVERGDSIKVGLRSGTYLEDYMREAPTGSKYKRLYESAIFYSDENSFIINEVREGKQVHIDWRSNLKYIMRREFLSTDTCDFTLSAEEFMEEQIALVFPLNSPYIKLFNSKILRLHQIGLIDRWIKEYLPPKDRCSKQLSVAEVDNHTVNLDDMQGCFILLLFGFAAGITIIFIECLWRYFKKRQDRDIIKPFVE